MTLADLPLDTPAQVQSLDPGAGLEALMELGVVPGTRVRVVRYAPLGDPLQVDVGGAHLALRRAAAATVHVEVTA